MREKNNLWRRIILAAVLLGLILAGFFVYLSSNRWMTLERNANYIADAATQSAKRIDDLLVGAENSISAIAHIYERSLDASQANVEVLEELTESTIFAFFMDNKYNFHPTPTVRLTDALSLISDSSSHSPKHVRLPQTPDIPFGSSPRPRRHTASPASRTRASAPAGSATPRSFPERPHRIPRPMLPESASRPPGDKNKTAAQRDAPSAPSSRPSARNAPQTYDSSPR